MVSSINSVRVWTQQVALRAFNEADGERNTAPSRAGSLADRLHTGAADDGEDRDLAALIASLRQQAMTGGTAPAKEQDGSVDDISSDAFMKALQEKIDALKANPDTRVMAEAMQEALDAGTLTITDAVAGKQIIGRDLTDKKDEADATTEIEKDPSQEIRSIESSDWSSFLKEHLKRDPYGKYLRNEDTSHIDKATGASSYFGMIGETNYYISWTAPKNTETVTIQI